MAINFQACFAEFVAMLLFVFVCCGAATGVAGEPGWVQQVSLTFGLCIAVLVYTIGHRSGGQINCAVTLGLAVGRFVGVGDLALDQALANVAFQLLGSISGAWLLASVKDADADRTGALACNSLADGVDANQALVAEVLGTFLLMYCVLETAVSPRSSGNRAMAPLAIGMAVYLAHSILIPIDGCSINPTRSFGPAVVATVRYSGDQALLEKIWGDHWIFWAGPALGALLGVLAFKVMSSMDRGESAERAGAKPEGLQLDAYARSDSDSKRTDDKTSATRSTAATGADLKVAEQGSEQHALRTCGLPLDSAPSAPTAVAAKPSLESGAAGREAPQAEGPTTPAGRPSLCCLLLNKTSM